MRGQEVAEFALHVGEEAGGGGGGGVVGGKVGEPGEDPGVGGWGGDVFL